MNSVASPSKKIIWLASYPKSGNTWFRTFLTALLNEDALDINNIKTDGIFSSRLIFDTLTDIDSTCLYDSEVKMIQPEVYNHLSSIHEKDRLFIKIHDAYTLNRAGRPIVPEEATRCAVYFIRNPLDIAGSWANHSGCTIDRSIELLNDPESVLSQPDNFNVNVQLTQLMLSWSGHVKSWTAKLPFPVLPVRFEDMLNDGFNTFSKVISFIGLDIPDEKIEQAISATRFEQLQQKEKEGGFKEKLVGNHMFFRKGKADNWKNELNDRQIESIINCHYDAMKKFNYLPAI